MVGSGCRRIAGRPGKAGAARTAPGDGLAAPDNPTASFAGSGGRGSEGLADSMMPAMERPTTMRGISESLLRSHGVQVDVLDDAACIALMQQMLDERPALWLEDIGEES